MGTKVGRDLLDARYGDPSLALRAILRPPVQTVAPSWPDWEMGPFKNESQHPMAVSGSKMPKEGHLPPTTFTWSLTGGFWKTIFLVKGPGSCQVPYVKRVGG